MLSLRRFALAVVSLACGVALAEGALRVSYSTLPSLAGLAGDTSWREGDAIQRCDARALAPRHRPQPPASERRLLVVGDSVALGFGVPDNARFGARIAERLSAAGPRWSEVNGALAGGTACITLELARGALSTTRADLAVVALFADDLMEAPRFSVNGRSVAFPDTVHTPALRWIVTHSYAMNAGWWAFATAFLDRSRSLGHDGPTVAAFVAALDDVRRAATENRTPVVLTLLPPAGLPFCASGGTEPEVCALRGEQDRIAELLSDAWPGWVDLRAVLDGGDYRLDVEKADGRLDIHPNEAGHLLIAEALLPVVGGFLARPAPGQRAAQQRKPM